MVNLDQIKQLEQRVSKAIELMQNLKDENDVLKLELHDRQKRIDELENIVLVFRNDQAKIEEGILNALNHLSAFEDAVSADTYTGSESAGAVDGVNDSYEFESSESVGESSSNGAEVDADSSSDSDSQEKEDGSDQLDIF